MSATSLDYPGVGPQHVGRLALAAGGIAVVYFVASLLYSLFFSPLAKFPGPKTWAITSIPRLLLISNGREHQTFDTLHEKYGPIVRVSPNELSVRGTAQAWRDIHGFKKLGQPKLSKVFIGKSLNGVDSIINADDANHSRQRKILSHAFSDRALKEQEPMLMSWAVKMVAKLSQYAASGDEVDLLKIFNCTTFDVMGDLAFNEGLDMLEGGEYSPWVKTIFTSIKEAAPIVALKQLSPVFGYIVDNYLMESKTIRKKAHEHWKYTADRVDRRLQWTPDRPDLWTKILAKDNEAGGLSQEEHRSNAAILMIAGTETTATALSGLMYHLGLNPEHHAKLKAEIRGGLSSFEDLTLEKLAKMKYLQACLQEGLRMYPPVPARLPREVPAGGAVVCGEWLPGGAIVGIPQYATYRSHAHFKNPDKFHPERWLNDPEYAGDQRDSLEPFSVGPRNCIGKNLAWHEMRLLLSALLLHFDVKLEEESKHWDDQKVYFLWEKKPLIVTLTPTK